MHAAPRIPGRRHRVLPLERSSFLKRRGVYRTQSLEARAAAIEELVSRGTLDQSASLTPSDMTSRMRDATSETAIETALAAHKQTMLTDGGPKPD